MSLGWLKPPAVPADGVMSLADHLRELRYRAIVSTIVIVIGMIACAFFYYDFMYLLLKPWQDAKAALQLSNPDLNLQAVLGDVTAPFVLAMKVTGLAGLIVTSPFWIYQIWAYIVPALLAKEKRLAVGFLSVAIPLFLFGVLAAYWVLPQGIAVMMQFTPQGVDITNLFEINNYLNLLVQMMLIFGIGFLVPVFVVALNMIGVVSGDQLKKVRTYVIFGTFVFAAIATPGSDPFSMIALAVPMSLLFVGAEVICRVNDRRRAAKLQKAGLA